MDLSAYFLQLALTYNRHDGLHSPAQDLLRNAPTLLAEHAPAGITIQSGGGKGMATYTPWVGFFNPDDTDSPQRGTYIVYLASEDLEQLVLTLNQGMEYLRRDLGDSKARAQLAADAHAIRNHLAGDPALNNTAGAIDLRSKGARQRAYEAGNIAAKPMRSAPYQPRLKCAPTSHNSLTSTRAPSMPSTNS